MSIVVVGSIAFDSIKTPLGHREKALGGAANYFAMAAHFFSRVHMVGVVGEDFPESHLELLCQKNIDIEGIEKAPGKSFHWQGEYSDNLNEAKTIMTQLNVFEHFRPHVPVAYRSAKTIFLANIDPDLQIHVLQQMHAPKIRALDSMNFWIERKKASLEKAISMIDILFINDAEIRALSGEHNIFKALRAVSKMGARIVVIKRGEYGAVLAMDNHMSFFPAYPLEEVFDPTGAGDTFAGGFLAHLDQDQSLNFGILKQAMLLGCVMSSFVIEGFSFDRLLNLKMTHIEERRKKLLEMSCLTEL
jgi:sugar/nucleoside kinase (ribokinase family)